VLYALVGSTGAWHCVPCMCIRDVAALTTGTSSKLGIIGYFAYGMCVLNGAHLCLTSFMCEMSYTSLWCRTHVV